MRNNQGCYEWKQINALLTCKAGMNTIETNAIFIHHSYAFSN